MRSTLSAILFLALAATATAQQTPPASHFDGNSWWSHVKFLADDSLEGRDTGSEGLRKAQAYAVEQLLKAGLEPFYVDVDDVAAYLEKAKSLGGKMLVSPVEIPTGTFAWMQDPEGNTVGFWKAKK
jgi:hypothetical protein